jgi:uncharacterized protein (DUF2062 family)
VWITNPITMPPIFYGCYKLGAWILDVSIEKDFVMSLEYVFNCYKNKSFLESNREFAKCLLENLIICSRK